MAAKKSKEVQEREDSFRKTHLQLKQNHENFSFLRKNITDTLAHPSFATLISKFERDGQEMHESLVSASKADIEKIQAGVVARRSIVGYLRNAYEEETAEALRTLKEFESKNELFVKAAENADAAEQNNGPRLLTSGA